MSFQLQEQTTQHSVKPQEKKRPNNVKSVMKELVIKLKTDFMLKTEKFLLVHLNVKLVLMVIHARLVYMEHSMQRIIVIVEIKKLQI